ncbi:MAG: C1 family peptidase [Leptospiraceae bacterium]
MKYHATERENRLWSGKAWQSAGLTFLLILPSFGSLVADPCKNCGYRQAGWKQLSAIPGADLPGQMQPAPLPSEIDLSSQMPPVGYQGDQASCISWAAVYAVKSYYENLHRGWGFDSPFSGGPGHHVFSPAYSEALLQSGAKGATFPEALDVLLRKGAVPWSEMPYEPGQTGIRPSARLHPIAGKFRIEGYRVLSSHAPDGIKRQIAAGHPVMVGILLYENLLDLKDGVYAGPDGAFMGGHSVVIVGYDDDRENGAFKIMNSWSRQWGADGYGWISYDAMSQLIRTALIIEDSAPPDSGDVPGNLPAPEQILASRGESARHVEISWSPVPSALAYEIQRAPHDDSLKFQTVGYSTSTLFRDASVDPGRPYAYRVLSMDEKGRTPQENAPVVQGFASRNPDPSTRIEILGGKMIQKGTQIYAHLSWQSSAAAFEIQRWNETSATWQSLGTSREQEFKDYRVSPGARYTYRIRKVDTNIKGMWSRPLVLTAADENLPPAMVTGVQVSRGSLQGKIKLQWDESPGVQEYLIYRYDPSSQKWEGPFRTKDAAFQDTNSLRPGQWYGYRIVAINEAGSGPTSPLVYGRTSVSLTAERSIKELKAPEILGAHASDQGKVNLKWKAQSDATSYEILIAQLPGKEYQTKKTITSGAALLSQDFLLDEPGAYSIRIVAKSGPSVSPASEPVVAFLNPEPKKERWFGLDDESPWLKHKTYSAVDWRGEKLIEYKLRLQETGNGVQATLNGDRTRKFVLNAPAGSLIQNASGFQFVRSQNSRYIQLRELEPGEFTNGTLLFVAD